jgi:hypothetical protein
LADSSRKGTQIRCEIRDRLFGEYRDGVKVWVESVNSLVDHDRQWEERVEEARFRALVAKSQYENHIAEHDCALF